MRLSKRLLGALCCVALWSAAARADLVFGNLGASGTNALDPELKTTITDQFWVAQKFVVSGPNTYLQSVQAGLYDDDASTARVGLYLDGVGLLTTSTAAVSSATPTLHTFNFGYQLTSGSSYWVVLEAASGQYNWAFNEAGAFGTGQNASGWAPPSGPSPKGDQTAKTFNAGADGFMQANELRPTSFNIYATLPPEAVPEIDPSSLGSVAALLAGVFGLRERRRLKSA